MPVRFDDSLGVFVGALLSGMPKERLTSGWILRDASGRLAFVAEQPIVEAEALQAAAAVENAVSQYCRPAAAILDTSMPGVRSLISGSSILYETVRLTDSTVRMRVIDRRIVGQDWLKRPAPGWKSPGPARLVFSSMKGGVGRTTAVAVLATELARQGRKVLAIDLDLEAPGLGSTLIDEQTMPLYGALDWYVESGIYGAADPDLLVDMVVASKFGGGKGLIDVVPAVGRATDHHPDNFLAKLSRAYLDQPTEDGAPISFLELTQRLVRETAAQKSYDIVLIDARAGLNETTAAALLGLGADILLFGVDTPQTFASYGYLLAHLARITETEDDVARDDWLYRLRMVHAKASPDLVRQAAFRDRAYELFSRYLYRGQPLIDENGEPLLDELSKEPLSTEQFGLDDPEAPHFAWPVLSDANFTEFDPLSAPAQLTDEFYGRTYAALFAGVRDLLDDVEDLS